MNMTILSFKYEEMGIMGQDFVGNQFRWHPCTIENRSPAPQESHPLGVCYDFADG
jgi:hypothetical protein